MRKLNILKAIVDFIWIMSLLFFPFMAFLSISFILTDEMIDIPLKITNSEINLTSPFGKIALIISVLNFALLLVALFFFRKLMTNFKKRLIFEDDNQFLFDKIGNLVIISSVIYLVTDFLATSSRAQATIHFGPGPFLYLLGLGIFFKILAEVFKIGKSMKEENELTI